MRRRVGRPVRFPHGELPGWNQHHFSARSGLDFLQRYLLSRCRRLMAWS